MRPPRVISFFAVIGFLVFDNLAYATVYNFGNIQTIQTEHQNYADSPTSSMKINFHTELSTADNDLQKNNSINQFDQNDRNIILDENNFKQKDRHSTEQISNPVPVSEPENYAMILAGLGLIGFTARRRNRNS